MASDDQFELPDQQQLITEEAKIQASQKGYEHYQPDSEWTLIVNGFGGITDIQP